MGYRILIALLLMLGLYADAHPVITLRSVKGRVTCNGKGIEGVVVSSGVSVTKTDRMGEYMLYPNSDEAFVQISVPSGYIVEQKSTIPCFYQELATNKNVYDFKLMLNPADDRKHVFFAQADVQVTEQKDLATYRNEVVRDMKEHLTIYKNQDIFGVDLGDMVGDMPNLFPEYISSMSPLNIPFYRVIGNHDMAYWGRSFETSERTFNNYFGPAVYSFNKGKAHYIVINNNFYVGRDYFYMGYVDEKTFRWLEQDLAFVPKGSIVFLMMHIPSQLQQKTQPFSYNYTTIADQTVNAVALHKTLEGYQTHILSGHMHYNLNIVYNDNLFEHNTAAVCGTWWKAPVCLDGTPRGYAVYEVNDDSVRWYYKSAGFGKDHQLRIYYEEKAGVPELIANVWNYDDKWKVEWFENSKLMGDMERYKGYDPLAFELCSDKEKMKYDWISPVETEHLFRAKVKDSNASIQVKVTDRFGRVYTEQLKRRK
ncbi:calcineurin-like phosphoesterase C-terminal domain-containing protein [Niabella aquatica]